MLEGSDYLFAPFKVPTVFWALLCAPSAFVAGTQLWELTTSLPPSWWMGAWWPLPKYPILLVFGLDFGGPSGPRDESE